MHSRSVLLGLALLLAAGSPACRLFRRSPKTIPAPPPPPAISAPGPITQPATAKPEETSVPPPPELPPLTPDLREQPPVQVPKLPPPPRRRIPKTPEPVDPVPEAPPAPPVPELEQLLTPEQQQEYNQAIDRSIGQAQRNLAALSGRRLNRTQTAAVQRIQTFISQALEARKTDLLRAKGLAERADVLAEDLLRSVP